MQGSEKKIFKTYETPDLLREGCKHCSLDFPTTRSMSSKHPVSLRDISYSSFQAAYFLCDTSWKTFLWFLLDLVAEICSSKWQFTKKNFYTAKIYVFIMTTIFLQNFYAYVIQKCWIQVMPCYFKRKLEGTLLFPDHVSVLLLHATHFIAWTFWMSIF